MSEAHNSIIVRSPLYFKGFYLRQQPRGTTANDKGAAGHSRNCSRYLSRKIQRFTRRNYTLTANVITILMKQRVCQYYNRINLPIRSCNAFRTYL